MATSTTMAPGTDDISLFSLAGMAGKVWKTAEDIWRSTAEGWRTVGQLGHDDQLHRSAGDEIERPERTQVLLDPLSCPVVRASFHALDQAQTGYFFIGDKYEMEGDPDETQEEVATENEVVAAPDDEALLDPWACLDFLADFHALDKESTGTGSGSEETADVSGDFSKKRFDSITDEECSFSEYVEDKNADVGPRGRGRGRSLGTAAHRELLNDEGEEFLASGGRLRSSSLERRTVRCKLVSHGDCPRDRDLRMATASTMAPETEDTSLSGAGMMDQVWRALADMWRSTLGPVTAEGWLQAPDFSGLVHALGSCSPCGTADVSGDFSITDEEYSFSEYVADKNADVAHCERGRGRGRGRSLGTGAHREPRNDEEGELLASGGRSRASSAERRRVRAEPRDYRWKCEHVQAPGYYQRQLFTCLALETLEVFCADMESFAAAGQVGGWSATWHTGFDIDCLREVLAEELRDHCFEWSDPRVEENVLRVWKQFEPVMLATVRRKAMQLRALMPSYVYAWSEASTDAEDDVRAEESDDEFEWQYVS